LVQEEIFQARIDTEMEGGAGEKKSKGKDNEEELKTDGLKTQERDKGKLKEKVNFIARNREAAAAGLGGRGQQGKIQRKARPPGEPDAPRQVIPRQAPIEANKPRMTGAGAKVTENCRPSKLTSTSEATNKVPSRSTSLRPQASSSLSERPHSSQSKASKQETSLQKSRPQTSRLQQAERPKVQTGGGPPRRRVKDESETDLVTGMIKRNLHHLLSQIFLQQSDATLAGCRRVCSSWWRYLRNTFWRDPVLRNQLESRLVQRWRGQLCTRVEVVVSGATCKLRCAENFRPCKCLEKLNCAISGNAVIVDFGGIQYREVRRACNNENGRSNADWRKLSFTSASQTFPSEQFQVTLHLGLGLHLETSTWLSSPVFMEGATAAGASGGTRLKVEARGWSLQPSPGKAGELIVRGEDGLVESRVSLPSPDATVERLQVSLPAPAATVERLQEACGLVACLAGGRVFVYHLESLARGARHSALLFSSPELKLNELGVHFFHLTPSSLLMVTGTRLELVDFWKFSLQSATQGFVL